MGPFWGRKKTPTQQTETSPNFDILILVILSKISTVAKSFVSGGKIRSRRKSEFSVSHRSVSILAQVGYLLLFAFIRRRVSWTSARFNSFYLLCVSKDLLKSPQVNEEYGFLKRGSQAWHFFFFLPSTSGIFGMWSLQLNTFVKGRMSQDKDTFLLLTLLCFFILISQHIENQIPPLKILFMPIFTNPQSKNAATCKYLVILHKRFWQLPV